MPIGLKKIATRSIHTHIFAFCSKCGTPNHYIHTISDNAEFQVLIRRGVSNEEEQRKIAEAKLDEKLIAKRAQLIKKAEAGNFKEFGCVCSNCSHIDSWSQHNASTMGTLAWFLALVSFFSLLGVLNGLVFCIALLMLALPGFICLLIINGARNKHFKKLTKTMDRRNLPIVAEDMATLRQKVEAAFPGEKIVIPQ